MKKSTGQSRSPTVQKRLGAMAEERRKVLSLSPQQALEEVLQAPQPAALVHSFADQDLYLLIQDIGPEDALPLLALASDRQREFIFDLEAWKRDRVSPAALARWMRLMLAADPQRAVSWLAESQTELLEHFLFHNIEVRIREHDQDPAEFGPGFFTQDDVLYVRVADRPPVAEDAPEDARLEAVERRKLILDLLQRLALWDYPKYQAMLLEAMTVMPAEIEEEQYRLRNVRLAEKGFLPFEEAVGIYQPLAPSDLQRRALRRMPARGDTGLLSQAPVRPVAFADRGQLFSDALEKVEPGALTAELQAEFAALCNRLIVADRLQVSEKADLRAAVRKVCATITIGMEAAGGQRGNAAQAAGLIRTHSLTDLFRVGVGRVLRQRWRAQRWLQEAWFKQAGMPLTFWDEHYTGILGGLLLKRPRSYDPAGVESVYREFESSEDILRAEQALDEVMAMDRLLGAVGPVIDPALPRGALTYKNLLLTLWARKRLGAEKRTADRTPLLESLELSSFRRFFMDLFPLTTPEGGSRRTPEAVKADFFGWVASAAGRQPESFGDALEAVLTRLLAELAEEYGRVRPQDLDPRFIRLFLLHGPS